MRKSLAAALLFLFFVGLPISAQHLVIGEETWAADPTFVPASAGYGEAEVASNGEDYLIVWRGSRALHAQHVGADGVPSTPHGIVVPNSSASSYGLAVASSGGDFVIVWHERDSIWSAHVARDRSRAIESREIATVDAGPLLLIASDRGYLLVFEKGGDVFGRDGLLLDQSGNPMSAPFTIHGSEIVPREPLAGASNGTDYLLTFTTYGAAGSANNLLHTLRISGAGEVHPSTTISVGRSLGTSRLGYDGTRYVLTWSAFDDARQVMTSYSAPVDPNGFLTAPPQHLIDASVMLTADAEMILFLRDDRLFSLRLGPGGAPTGAQPFLVGRGSDVAGVAASSSGHLVLWTVPLQYAIIPRGSSSPLPLRHAATRPNWQSDVRVFSLEQVQVVVWSEMNEAEAVDIYAARVSNGQRLDGRGIRVARTNLNPSWSLLSATDGNRVFVAWREMTEIRGSFIDASGAASASIPLIALRPEHTGANFMSLFWTGTHYALVWSDNRSAGYRLLTSSGQFVGEGSLDLGDSGSGLYVPDLFVRTANGVALAFSRNFDVFVTQFTSELKPLAGPQLIAGTPAREFPTAIASDGSRVLVAWSEGTVVYPHPLAPLSYRYLSTVVGSNETSVLRAQASDAVWTGDSFLIATIGDPAFGKHPGGGGYRPRFGTGPSGLFVAYSGSTTEYGLGDSRVAMIQQITVLPSRRRAVAP